MGEHNVDETARPAGGRVPVVVTVAAGGDASAARELAASLGVPCASGGDGATAVAPSGALALRMGADGLALVGDGMELRGDLTRMLPRLRPGALQRELLVRAARLRGAGAPATPTALDATAGLGEDSLLLAAAGFSVTLCERDPVIAALLRDALRRAREQPALAPLVDRMRLVCGDSVVELRRRADAGEAPDVVLLDPMFPARQKSASVKKKLRMLQLLERPCDDEEALMRAAIGARPRKVVVKRPVKGPVLAGVKPAYTLAGKAVRYDCIIPASVGADALRPPVTSA